MQARCTPDSLASTASSSGVSSNGALVTVQRKPARAPRTYVPSPASKQSACASPACPRPSIYASGWEFQCARARTGHWQPARRLQRANSHLKDGAVVEGDAHRMASACHPWPSGGDGERLRPVCCSHCESTGASIVKDVPSDAQCLGYLAQLRPSRPPEVVKAEADWLQLSFSHQLGHRHIHGGGDARNRHDPRVLPAALDAAHVGPVNRTAVCQLFLRNPSRLAAAPDGRAQRHERWVVGMAGRGDGHRAMVDL